MPLDDALMAVLGCPKCHGKLAYRDAPETLICESCKLAYPVEDGIPVLLLDEARPV